MNGRTVKGTIRRAVAGLGLSAATLILALIAAELGLRWLIPPPSHYAMLQPGTRVFDPDDRFVHGIDGPAQYEVNPRGFRGRDFGPDSAEYRILLVGGSTTECALLDYEENWGTILDRTLSRTRDGRILWTGNVGRSGLTARDHAVTVKYLLQQYPRIDLVLVLVGVNDLTASLRQGDNYVRPLPITEEQAERIQVRNAFAVSPEGVYRPLTEAAGTVTGSWYKSTRLYDLARRARMGRRAAKVERAVGGSNVGQWRKHRQHASRIIDELPDLTVPLAEYRSNLDAIVAEARGAGAEVVFLTQPSLWNSDVTPAEERLLWLGGTGPFQEEPGQAYYSVAALATAMRRYNDATLQACRYHGLPCFDLAAAVPADTTLLYDDVHFTEAGAALVGRLVAQQLRVSHATVFDSAVVMSAQ